MQELIAIRQEIYPLLEYVKSQNSNEAALQGLKILKQLTSNLLKHKQEPKYRMIKTTNNIIQNQLMNVVGINDLLFKIGFICENDGNFYYNDSDFTYVEVTLGLLDNYIKQMEDTQYTKDMSKIVQMDPDVKKEKERVEKKLKEEKEDKNRILSEIESDKKERKYKFNYGNQGNK